MNLQKFGDYIYTGLVLCTYDGWRGMTVFMRPIKYISDKTKSRNMPVFTRTFLYIQRESSAAVRRGFQVSYAQAARRRFHPRV